MGLSAYLILACLYSTAVSTSQGARSAMEQSKFLNSIGSAHRVEEMEREIIRIATAQSNKMIKESGIQTSLIKDEIKNYLERVI